MEKRAGSVLHLQQSRRRDGSLSENTLGVHLFLPLSGSQRGKQAHHTPEDMQADKEKDSVRFHLLLVANLHSLMHILSYTVHI